MSDMGTPTFTPDDDDIVVVSCQCCTWSSAFQFDPDEESVAQFAADVAEQGAYQYAEHAKVCGANAAVAR